MNKQLRVRTLEQDTPKDERRTRARSADKKALIREKFIDVGRQLFKDADAATISLRRIAKEAGYTPSTIYTYFTDHHALLTAIRSTDMAAAIQKFEAVRASQKNPVNCIRTVFAAVVDHWVEHFDHFEVVYAQRRLPDPVAPDAAFANSDVVRRLYQFYYEITAEFLNAHGSGTLPADLATDTIIASTHGMILFTRRTANKPWPDVRLMTDLVVDDLLMAWGSIEPRPRAKKATAPRPTKGP